LLLAVRMAAVAALVIWLAGPRLAPRAGPPRALLVVVDNSPSTLYEDAGGSRLARAARMARARVDAASADDVVCVAWTGGSQTPTRWLYPASASRELAVVPAAGGGVADAFARAAAAWDRAGFRRRPLDVAVFTDLQEESFRGLTRVGNFFGGRPQPVIYDVRREPGPLWNVSLEDTGVAPGAGDFQVRIGVRQFGRPRPLVLKVSGNDGRDGGAYDVPAAAAAKVRVELAGGKSYAFECRGGYAFDDRLEATLPAAPTTYFDVLPATAGATYWTAALAAAGAEAAAGRTDGPAIVLAPLDAWGAALEARTARGAVVVLVPGRAGGVGFDASLTWGPYTPSPASAVTDGDVLPHTSRAGLWETTGYAPGKVAAPWSAAARTTAGEPVLVRRYKGRGELFVFLTPVGPSYCDLYATAAFPALASDLRTRALMRYYGAFPAASERRDGESSPATVDAVTITSLFPGAVTAREVPAARGRRGARSLAVPTALGALVLLAVEMILVTAGGPRPGNGGVRGRSGTESRRGV